jgi:hypothetical protein
MLVFTGGPELTPQGMIPLDYDINPLEVTFLLLSHAVPLVINFNKKTQPLIGTLPIKVMTPTLAPDWNLSY